MASSSSTSWKDFLKSIALFNGDLYLLTAPPFILLPVSLVEYSKFWCEHPDLFLAPNKALGPLEQQLAVTRWFIATLRSQYASRNENMGTEKKPLNPFLGEIFTGKWSSAELGDTVLQSEQVSHHPPITAYEIVNDKHNTRLFGYNEIKSKIYATSLQLAVSQYGHAMVEYGNGAQYLVTLPGLHIEGLLMASPYVELEGKLYIVGSNGYITVIEYTGKGWVSGKKNLFKAKIYENRQKMHKKDPECTISGQWSGVSHVQFEKHKKQELFYDLSKAKPVEIEVKPVEQQEELESRRAWLEVAQAIKEGLYEKIALAKSELENKEREKRRVEREEGRKWHQKWFREVSSAEDATFRKLCEKGGLSGGNVVSGTKGEGEGVHWRPSECYPVK